MSRITENQISKSGRPQGAAPTWMPRNNVGAGPRACPPQPPNRRIMAIIEESEFKGNAMLVLKRTPDDKFPFQFGLGKAKLMVECIEEIKVWVAKQEAAKAAKD